MNLDKKKCAKDIVFADKIVQQTVSGRLGDIDIRCVFHLCE
jgi:hypothetical protein